MKRAQFRERFRDLAKDPSELLAYLALRQSMKDEGVNFSLDNGFIVVIVPAGFRAQPYKSAASVVLNAEVDEWGLPRATVRLAKPPKRKGAMDQQPSIFDLQGLRVLLATHVNEVPKEVRFVARQIVSLKPPCARDINAARRVLRLPELTKEQVGVLIGKPENVILAGMIKPAWSEDDARALLEVERPDHDVPSLFDLPGFEEQKDWARDLAKDVDRWRQGRLGWNDVAQSALVSGPPGAGKTYFASALATALGFRLIQTTVGKWQSGGYLNDVLAAMRRSFEDAVCARGAVLFIDEFDCIGSRPTRPTGHPNETYWQVVINEFLSLMNSPGEGVIVLGATNYPKRIDRAILRSGRIEKHFMLDLPGARTRAEILRYHTGGALSVESLVDIANNLGGSSAAALEELVRTARKRARNEDRELQPSDLRALMPERRSYTPEEMFRLGVHEAGHALIALALGYANAATIEVHDSFNLSADFAPGGRTCYDLVDHNLPTETVLLNRIAVGLAGMAAEATVFADRSLGSGGIIGSDVEVATGIARRLVGSYGLGETPIFLAIPEELTGKKMPAALEEEAMKILRTQYERVLRILITEKDGIIALAGDAAALGRVRIERQVPGDGGISGVTGSDTQHL